MNNNQPDPDAQNMPPQSYPSPTTMAVDHNGAPFYSSAPHQPPHMAPSNDLQHLAQVTRNLAPTMGPGNMVGAHEQEMNRGPNHQFEHGGPQHQHPAELRSPSEPMDQSGFQYDSSEPAAKQPKKVSRACDHCRGKKVKCDSVGDGANRTACSHCLRVSKECRFSRQPLKRGPSKGYHTFPNVQKSTVDDLFRYIRLLATRVEYLEGRAGVPQYAENQFLDGEAQPLRRGSQDYSPPPHADNGQRKRTYSNSNLSGDLASQYQPPPRPQQIWAPHDQRQPFYQPQQSPQLHYHQNQAPTASMYGGTPSGPENNLQQGSAMWKAAETGRSLSISSGEMQQGDRDVVEWDSRIVDR